MQGCLPSNLIQIKPLQLVLTILQILPRLHAHVEDGAILITADDLAVNSALAPLTLRPQPSEAYLHLVDLGQASLIQLSKARSAALAYRAFGLAFPRQGRFAAHASLRLLGKLH
jgi:hypothetical protein